MTLNMSISINLEKNFEVSTCQVKIDWEKCNGSASCVGVCPTDVFEI